MSLRHFEILKSEKKSYVIASIYHVDELQKTETGRLNPMDITQGHAYGATFKDRNDLGKFIMYV